MKAKKVRLMETVLRDGHQSVLATRMRTEQMVPVLEQLDEIGYDAIECWVVQHLTAAFVSLMKIRGNVCVR